MSFNFVTFSAITFLNIYSVLFFLLSFWISDYTYVISFHHAHVSCTIFYIFYLLFSHTEIHFGWFFQTYTLFSFQVHIICY